MTDYDQLSALKSRVASTTGKPALDLKQAQDFATAGTLPTNYALLFLSRRFIDQPARLNGTTEPRGYRLTTRVMAKGSIVSAYELERLVRSALVLNPITLDGELVDVRYETGGGDFDIDDAGYYFANSDWIYVR